MLTKSQLKEVFANYSFRPLKRLGENYLIDGNIRDKIVEEVCISKDDIILEIGPGLGALTLDLATSAYEVIAVEKDKKAFEILSDILDGNYENVKLLNEDILKLDLKELGLNKTIKVVGNLPYYITTPIIEYLIENKSYIDSIIIMVQREVASRIMASPGAKDYSSLSCFVQYYVKPSYIHTVKSTSFYPIPEVDSSIIRLDIFPRSPVDVKDEKMFFRIVRGAFNQRRKSIVNSISRKAVLDIEKDKLIPILNTIGIDPSLRPESLSLSEFAKITNAVISLSP